MNLGSSKEIIVRKTKWGENPTRELKKSKADTRVTLGGGVAGSSFVASVTDMPCALIWIIWREKSCFINSFFPFETTRDLPISNSSLQEVLLTLQWKVLCNLNVLLESHFPGISVTHFPLSKPYDLDQSRMMRDIRNILEGRHENRPIFILPITSLGTLKTLRKDPCIPS